MNLRSNFEYFLQHIEKFADIIPVKLIRLIQTLVSIFRLLPTHSGIYWLLIVERDWFFISLVWGMGSVTGGPGGNGPQKLIGVAIMHLPPPTRRF